MASKKPDRESSARSKTAPASGSGDDCNIAIDCDLSGIRPEALANLRKGDRLGVRIEPGEPYRSVVCVISTGAIVGAISAFPGHGRLIRCLEQGVVYEVAVQNVGAGRCHVVGGVAL